MKFEVQSVIELKDVAKAIIHAYPMQRIFILRGEMGAGKTTLVSKFFEILECEGHASSPTFSIVNEYYSPLHKKIYHFDCYRLKHENEAFDIGIEDYLDSNFYCFIEWPEKIANLIPANHVCIEIEEHNLVRTITVSEEK